MTKFIDDGYTREQFIDVAEGPALRILYRPMLAAERRRLALQTVRLAGRGNAGRQAAARLVVSAIAARLVEWDLAGADGMPIEIHGDAVAALDPPVFEAIHSTVTRFDDEGASAKN
jgi:hypothetical protein